MIHAEALAVQCRSCIHWQVRGGAVFEPVRGCEAFESCGTTGAALKLMKFMALQLAGDGRCPTHEAVDSSQMPDAYKALDLVDQVDDFASGLRSGMLDPSQGLPRIEDDVPTPFNAPKRGRKPTTGRFETRAALCDFVWASYGRTTAKAPQIAVNARTTEAVVNKILNTGEGKPIPASAPSE